MPVWMNASNGSWSDSSRWTGGIPNGAGAVAEFTVASSGTALFIVSFSQDALFTVGTLNIVTDNDDGWIFRGAVNVTSATLRLSGANGAPAFINIDTNGSTRESGITSDLGMRVNFASDVILTTQNSDTFFRISAPIIGDGDLYKYGDGTLVLNGANSGWGGDLFLLAGRTELSNPGAGSAKITLGNDAELVTSGTLANRIQVNDDPQISSISAITAGTLTLSGLLISESSSTAGLRFGSVSDTGTIILTGTNIMLGTAGLTIGGGTVRLGSASVAANYFSNFSSEGLLQIGSNSFLDTNGHATFLDNLDMDGGTILSGTGALNLTVNDTLTLANAQAGTIQGTAGADRLVINVLNNFSIGSLNFTSWTGGTDTISIVGSSNANFLSGSSQNDTIDGAGGADTMSGGGGNDTYIVDNAGDIVTEAAGEGFDAVYSLVSFALTASSQVEWLSTFSNNDVTAINLTGSDLGQFLLGSNGANVLDGKGGADFMQGFGGNDIYYVDNIGDAPVEQVGGGSDTVYSTINYLLPTGREIETLSAIDNSSSQTIDLVGNEFAQTLMGTNGVNALDGSGGADTMIGYGGNDTYFADNAGDQAIEAAGGGFDAVYTRVSLALGAGTEIEWLSAALASSTDALNLSGNEFGQFLLGNAGANILNGRGGNDTLQGYGGADTFQFTTAPGAGNVDTIVDFVSGTDKIALDDAIFAALGAPGALSAAAFVTGTAATSASHRVIYDSATGRLFYDADGNGAGAAVQFASLQGNPALSASDFQVI